MFIELVRRAAPLAFKIRLLNHMVEPSDFALSFMYGFRHFGNNTVIKLLLIEGEWIDLVFHLFDRNFIIFYIVTLVLAYITITIIIATLLLLTFAFLLFLYDGSEPQIIVENLDSGVER